MSQQRVFKVREFDRWMRKTSLTDEALCTAVTEMAAGLIDADLGGGVLKKRVALPGKGKSGGFRTLVATNKDDRWFFVFGFEKAERSNVSAREATALKAYASDLLKLETSHQEALIAHEKLVEICHDHEGRQEAREQAGEPSSERRSRRREGPP